MNFQTPTERSRLRRLARADRHNLQLERLNRLLHTVRSTNRFYASRLAKLPLPLESLSALPSIPETTRAELEQSLVDDPSGNSTFPPEQYVRVHRTSGTSGRPLYVYDTADDWSWWRQSWQFVLDAAHVKASDRAFMAFSFGPFIGFWSAHDAIADRGAMTIPAGGMSTRARLDMMQACDATLVCCTPTYALRMAEVARASQLNLADNSVTRLIVAGEPGGSLSEVRRKIESAWNAQVIDHAGASEIGPWGYGDPNGQGIFVNESDFIAELIPLGGPNTAADPDALHRLVLTGLGRTGWPLIRYNTGDLVRPSESPDSGDTHLFLQGGILGRADDMVVVRGVNIFPSSIENILRSVDSIDEFRVTAFRQGTMDQLGVEVETQHPPTAVAAAEALQQRLGLRIDVEMVPLGTLPRSEAKSQRFVDRRPP